MNYFSSFQGKGMISDDHEGPLFPGVRMKKGHLMIIYKNYFSDCHSEGLAPDDQVKESFF